MITFKKKPNLFALNREAGIVPDQCRPKVKSSTENSGKTVAAHPDLQSQAHTQNSVKRPQNRHLKPFKSRAELNGQLDSRINIGGRPKILFEESAKFLEKRDKNGVTNAQKQIEHLHEVVMSNDRDRVAAFNALRNAACPPERARRQRPR
jgi:hypothetical protein